MKNLTVNMPLAVPHQRPPSKYASHPYPVLVDEDAYSPNVKPIDIVLRKILQETYINDAYIPSITATDFTLEPSLKSRNIDDDAYTPTVTVMNVLLEPALKNINISGGAYQPIMKPLNLTLKRVVIDYIHPNDDAYKITVKTLDFILKTGV